MTSEKMAGGEAATRMLVAQATGRGFDAAGVPDTTANRRLWLRIMASLRKHPKGTQIEVPFDHVT